MKINHIKTLIFTLTMLFICSVSSFADDDTSGKTEAEGKRFEVPVFGVRFVTEFCTKELDIESDTKSIELSYQVFINPENFRELQLSFTCREITKNANKLIEFATLDLPTDSRIYTFEFPAPNYASKLVFLLKLTLKQTERADPAYSQEFTCNVYSSKSPNNQTQPDKNDVFEVSLKKPIFKTEQNVDKLIDTTFYNIELRLNVIVKNPKLPIIWTRAVDYTCSKNLPEYLKNTLPPTKTKLECEIAYIEALPPGKTQELQQTIKLVYVKDMFPLMFNQVETVKIGDAEFKIEIKFKILDEKKFPPAISVKLISEGKNLQVFELH